MKIASWRTTAAGLAAILSTVALAVAATFDNDPTTIPDWNNAIIGILAGIGLIFARDNKVTSEQAHAGVL